MVNFFKPRPRSQNPRFDMLKDIPGNEIDLRFEMDMIMFEEMQGEGAAQPFVIRRMRRDDNNSLIYSPTMDPLTRHPTEDINDDVGHNERFLFDDYYAYAFKAPLFRKLDTEDQTEVGKFHQHRYFLFIPYNQLTQHTANVIDILDRHDRIIEPMLDQEGKIQNPMRPRYLYNLVHVEPRRGDHGRIEFFRTVVQAASNFRNI